MQGILPDIFSRKIMTTEGINRLTARGAMPHHLKKSRHIKPPASPINGKPTHSIARASANCSPLYYRAFSCSLSPMLFHHKAGRRDKPIIDMKIIPANRVQAARRVREACKSSSGIKPIEKK
jgi:hypothetical protein